MEDSTIHIRGDVAIHYRLEGRKEGPLILLSNSLSTNLHSWDNIASRLRRQKYSVLRYDQRGHGLSPPSSEACTFSDLAADVTFLLDKLGIVKIYAFCGISMGAATGVYFAAQYPERLERLIVADVLTSSSPQGNAAMERRIELAQDDDGTRLADDTLSRWFPASSLSSQRESIANIRTGIIETPVQGFINCVRALQSFDLGPLLPHLNHVAVLFIVGEHDGALPQSMEKLAAQVPHAKLVTIAAAGHLSMIDGEEQFAKALEDFLQLETKSTL